jgi:hypothetical protein
MRTENEMELRERLTRMTQRDIGGDHLWIKPNGDCLTVSRCSSGIINDEPEGDWSDEEIDMAIELYEETEASRR